MTTGALSVAAGGLSVACPEPASQFDYGSVEPSVAKYLRGEADRIRRQYAASIVQIGKALLRAKRYLGHGEFIRWVEGEAGIPARSAQTYMRVGRWVADKSVAVAHLPPTVLYVLSSPSTPEAVVLDVLKRVDAGERVPPIAVIRREASEVRQAKRGRHVAPVPASSDQRAGADDPEVKELLREALGLVAHRLTADEFDRFRDIMTCSTVLDDPMLARNMLAAFSTLERSIPGRSERGLTFMAVVS